MKTIILIIFILVLQTSFAKEYIVHAIDVMDGHSMVFKPSFLHIEIGDSVNFIPLKGHGHQPQMIFGPEGQSPWRADKGKPIKVKFEKEGIHIFNCKFHFVMGMAGIIQVGKATNYQEAKDFIKNYKSKIAIKKNRIDEIFNKIIIP
ncbi:plastocyanin/azurin family copper-binding protein [Halobacteriovorax sp. GFR7]|uniref:plastocyanin/azurin family copper-binding protein n=1 Tax=unclassified Halobacteriovorax TaxID=2639665 RepID=UPI003D995C51